MDEARALARRRWDSPENVERRIDALAARVKRVVDTLPPLTPEQHARLAAPLEDHIRAAVAAAPPLDAETLDHLRRLLPPVPVHNPGTASAELTDAPAAQDRAEI